MQKQPSITLNRVSFLTTYINRLKLFSFLIFTLTLVNGCSFPGVYKINVQQGAIITPDMLEQLKPGMTPKQVHFVLGTPSAPNAFSDKIDTYYYSFQKAGKEIKSQRIIIHYDSDQRFSHYTGKPLEKQPAY